MTKTNPITTSDSNANPAAALWRIVVSEYEAANAEFQRCAEASKDADETYCAETEAHPDFETYKLSRHQQKPTREQHIRDVEVTVAITDYAGIDRHLTPDELAAITKKAAQLVDDYEAYWQHCEAVEARTIGKTEDAFQQSLDALFDARERLFATPAPDAEALLYKLDVLAPYMAEVRSDDAERVALIASDARRLLKVA